MEAFRVDNTIKHLDYDKAFQAFLEQTNEKKATAALLGDFFEAYAREGGRVGKAGQPARILDIGCGEGKFAASFIDAATHMNPDGFDYNGFDVSADFTAATKQAVGGLDNIKACHTFETRDAFNDPRLTVDHNDLILISHALYYLDESKLNSFLKKMRETLNGDGLMFLLHQSNEVEWARITIAHGKKMKDYTALFASQSLPYVEVPVYAKIELPVLDAAQVRQMEEALKNQVMPNDEAIRKTLCVLAFLANEPEHDLSGKLVVPEFVKPAFASEMMRLASRNGNNIYTLAKLQIIPAEEQSQQFMSRLQSAAAATIARNPAPMC